MVEVPGPPEPGDFRCMVSAVEAEIMERGWLVPWAERPGAQRPRVFRCRVSAVVAETTEIECREAWDGPRGRGHEGPCFPLQGECGGG